MRNQGSASDSLRSSSWRRPRSTDPSSREGVRRHRAADLPPVPGRAPRIDLDALAERSPNPAVCPFLRLEAASGGLVAPLETAEAGHRCGALRPALELGEAQQELLCLSGAFTACPRYARGVARLVTARARPRRRRSPLGLRAASIVLGVVAASAAGHALAGAAIPVPSGRVGTPSADSHVAAAELASAAGESAAQVAAASHSRLERCPDADCYLWTVRNGDTVAAIARHLDVPITALLALNPELVASGELRVGDRLRVPPPGA